ncbi:MAG: sugar phosphate isomerase/epimerase [Victivallaceae bacterium]|nr:sugar phosphate isomerase/epimerase [Victivallaceae bacterium]
MKIGIADYGFNVWDGGLYDIEERLVKLKSRGFQGIERIEAISPSDALHKSLLYRRLGMDFGTCRGPSVQAGIEWTCALGKDYVWLAPGDMTRETPPEIFYRRANIMVATGKKHGLKVGLHNHLRQVVESPAELHAFLKNVPGASSILDTAHLALCGGDPIEFIGKYANRLCAVHFKDAIKSETGHISQPLGQGNLGLDHCEIAEALIKSGYDGWIFIEPENPNCNPLDDAGIGLDLLRSAGFFN